MKELTTPSNNAPSKPHLLVPSLCYFRVILIWVSFKSWPILNLGQWNRDFSDSSVGKESTCNAGDPSSIPGSGRSDREGIGYPLKYSWASLVAQLVMSNSLRPHGPYSPRNSLGQYTGVGSLSLLQGSNPGLPHCRQILYQLSHQGSTLCLQCQANYCYQKLETVFNYTNVRKQSFSK